MTAGADCSEQANRVGKERVSAVDLPTMSEKSGGGKAPSGTRATIKSDASLQRKTQMTAFLKQVRALKEVHDSKHFP